MGDGQSVESCKGKINKKHSNLASKYSEEKNSKEESLY